LKLEEWVLTRASGLESKDDLDDSWEVEVSRLTKMGITGL